QDVITLYDGQHLVSLAEFPIDFANKIDYALTMERNSKSWLNAVDESFKGMSWNKSCSRLEALEQDIYATKSSMVFQESLRELFKGAFHRKSGPQSTWVQGINLKKMNHKSS